MGRFLAPLIAFGAAAFVYTKNQGAENEFFFLFPTNLIFEDPAVAGERSWQILLLVGGMWLLGDIAALMRRRAADADEDE